MRDSAYKLILSVELQFLHDCSTTSSDTTRRVFSPHYGVCGHFYRICEACPILGHHSAAVITRYTWKTRPTPITTSARAARALTQCRHAPCCDPVIEGLSPYQKRTSSARTGVLGFPPAVVILYQGARLCMKRLMYIGRPIPPY